MDEQLGELYETATRTKQMDHKKGIATVFRGNEALGVVEYDFNMTDNGRVTGWIVEVKHINLHPMAPRVPPTLLQKSAGAADLHLSLGDGTGVAFLVVTTDGAIVNGRRYQEKA